MISNYKDYQDYCYSRAKRMEGVEMITEKQERYLLDLYEELRVVPDVDVYNLTKAEAGVIISNMELKKEIRHENNR